MCLNFICLVLLLSLYTNSVLPINLNESQIFGNSNTPTSNRTGRLFFDALFRIGSNLNNVFDFDDSDGDVAASSPNNLRTCNCDCGTSNGEIRIVGGKPTGVNQYPWMARIVYDGKFHCGGTLMTRDYVMTAAHCVKRLKRTKIRIILGDHDQHITSDTKAIQRAVTSIVKHRHFDPETYNYDIALLRLRKPVSFNKNIKPVCLPRTNYDPSVAYVGSQNGLPQAIIITTITSESGLRYNARLTALHWKARCPTNEGKIRSTYPRFFLNASMLNYATKRTGSRHHPRFANYVGRIGTVVGWGRTSEGGELPGIVNHVKVPILTLNECRSQKYKSTRITTNMLCAGKPSQDSCQGDSGGPLLLSNGYKFFIVGIVSWGVGCGREGYPGVYTRVSKFVPWIKANLQSTCLCV